MRPKELSVKLWLHPGIVTMIIAAMDHSTKMTAAEISALMPTPEPV